MLDLLAADPDAVAEPWRAPASFWGGMTDAIADLSARSRRSSAPSLQRGRPRGARRRSADPRGEQVDPRAGHRCRASCPGTAGSSPSRCPRRSGSPRTMTTSCWAIPQSTVRRSPASPPMSGRHRITLMVDDPRPGFRPRRRRSPRRGARPRCASRSTRMPRGAPRPRYIGVRRSPLRTAGDSGFARAIVDRPRLRARRAHDVRGADRRSGRRHRIGRRTHPMDAEALRSRVCSTVAPRSFRACARSSRSNSSTAAARGRWSTPGPITPSPRLTAGSGLLAGHLFDGYRAFEARTGRGVRAGGRAQAAARHRHRPRRRVDRVRPACRIPPAAAVVAAGLRTLPREGAGECRPRCRGMPRAASRSATGYGSVIPRAARSRRARRHLSGSSRGTASSRPPRPTAGKDTHSCDEAALVTRIGGTWQNWGRSARCGRSASSRPATLEAVQRAVQGCGTAESARSRPSVRGTASLGSRSRQGAARSGRISSGIVSVDRGRARVRLLAGTRLHRDPRLLHSYGLAMAESRRHRSPVDLRRHLHGHTRHRARGSAASPRRSWA